MKHLKSINETFKELSNQVMDILSDIKDDYPNLGIDILNMNDPGILCSISLNCKNVKPKEEFGTIDFYKSKNKFIDSILNTFKRLENALDIVVYIPDLDYWQFSSVKITLFKKK